MAPPTAEAAAVLAAAASSDAETPRPHCGVVRRPSIATLFGPGVLIAVGYMDLGNWATALAGGARFGYRLLWVVALASLGAMLLQWVAARIGVVTGRDLARLCRERLPRGSVVPLWLASEVAIGMRCR